MCAPAMGVICLREGVDTGSFCVHRHVYMSMCVHITWVPCVSTGLLKASDREALF